MAPRKGHVPRSVGRYVRSLKQQARRADSDEKPELVARIEDAYAQHALKRAGGDAQETVDE